MLVLLVDTALIAVLAEALQQVLGLFSRAYGGIVSPMGIPVLVTPRHSSIEHRCGVLVWSLLSLPLLDIWS
jgi:hypothetical protein